MSSACAVGIDLGTTFSSIAVYRNGHSEVIPNPLNNSRLIPSAVFYDPRNTVLTVGEYAEEWGLKEKSNFIYDTKRLMGRKFDDVDVQDLIINGHYNYKIVAGDNNDAKIEIVQNNQVVTKFPEEICAEILKKLKEYGEQYLGHPVTEAVISVPAHFGNAQRNATMRAAEIAGLKVLKLISEPVAAAIHYSMDRIKSKSTILVFDLGGGTLDVSVIDVDNDIFTVRGTEGDSYLGGVDFNRNLIEHFFHDAIENLLKTNNQRTIAENLLRVKKKCNTLKTQLSSIEQSTLSLDHFGIDNESFILEMSRQKFEDINHELFERALGCIAQCLSDLEISENNIDEVVLVGGSSKIPKICKMLATYFVGKNIKTDLNADEAVALGSAVQAAMLKNTCKELEKYKITEVTANTLGFQVNGGLMLVAIKKNTPLPADSNIIITTTLTNNQSSVTKSVFEGNRKNCKFNSLVGTLKVNNIPPKRAGDEKIKTIFKLNSNGILDVETWTLSNGERANASFNLQEHRLGLRQKKKNY